ncbi:hypothetical protein GOB57_21355 [Sinorhizobium meliloti]|nr:hypothetical protein [Sinorhizobium meliloti]
MNALNVILCDDGAFEITSPYPGKRDFKIIYDGAHDCHPWRVISEMGGSGVWRDEDSFQCLDEAMDWAVSLSSETYPVPGYGVTLPCGTFFSRPGKVKIEDVMAAIGWSYVISVDGWSPVKYPKGTPHATVAAYFQDLLEDTAAILGSIDPEIAAEGEDEAGMELWIADVTIPVYNFVHRDDAQATFLSLFEEEGIPCMDSFDYTGRVNVNPHTATIIELEPFRTAREPSSTAARATSAEAGR